jgi:hypothetical protein
MVSVTTCRRHPASAALVRLAIAGLASCWTVVASAQSTPPAGTPAAVQPQLQAVPSEPPPTAAGQAQPRQNAPGLFAAIGRWMDDSVGNMTSSWKNTRSVIDGIGDRASDAAKSAAGAAKEAVSAIPIPSTSIVIGRQHCRSSTTGGPDCVAAAEALCRAKGHAGGTSLHIQSEQKCPVWGWISGQKPVGKCGAETYVTSAMCR